MNLPVYSIFIPNWTLILLGFLMAFGITWVTIPSVVNISRLKDLCSKPNGRTSHTNYIPSLGGIAVFIGLVLSTVIFAGIYFKFELKYIFAGLLIVFFVGIKDDIMIIDPVKKLAGQIFAIVLIAVFVFIVIINGLNLIDGIDGLASGIGILTSTVFGIWFWMTGNIGYAIFSFSFVGTLAAFFRFNVFSKTNKIFLGDTGSLLTGFVVGVLACRFLQLELVAQGTTFIISAPTVVCGILIVPLFDSLRVFILRIKQGKSPFKADRQHIHHRLLQLGCSHLQATLILISVNLFFIVLSYLLRGIGIIWLMCVILGLASLMSQILFIYAKERSKKEIDSVLSLYFAVKIHQYRNRKIGIAEKRPIMIPVYNSQEKVHAVMN